MERLLRGDTEDEIIKDLMLGGLDKKEAVLKYAKTAEEFYAAKISAVRNLGDFFTALMTDSDVTKKSINKQKDKAPKRDDDPKNSFSEITSLINLFFSLGYSEEVAIRSLASHKVPEQFTRSFISRAYKALMSRPIEYIELERKHVLNTKHTIQSQRGTKKEELIERLVLAGWSKIAASFLVNLAEKEMRE
ncbi:MAG: hypothetical protein WD751_08595 [Anaerolineales bacterium]